MARHARTEYDEDAVAEAEKEWLEKVEALQKKVEDQQGQIDALESQALAAANAVIPGTAQEVPTGKFIKVRRGSGYKVESWKDDGTPIVKVIFKEVDLPTFKYLINLPPCGGTDLKLNGVAYYHNTVYELDLDTLRSVKEIVARCWDHDKQIHGTDENFYRQKGNYESTIGRSNRMSAGQR